MGVREHRISALSFRQGNVVLWPLSHPVPSVTSHSVLTAAGRTVPTTIVHDCLSTSLEQLTQRFQQIDARKRAKIQRCQTTLHVIPLEARLTQLQHLGAL